MISKAGIVIASAVCLALSVSTKAALAHAPSDPNAVGNLKVLIPSSGMIFQGRVTKVQYVNATQSQGGIVPHAYVTYSLSDVMFPKSQTARKSITLRMIGGPDGQGRFLDVEGVPKFAVGNEDILFLRSNGTDGCAIVTCEFGRYRILDNRVYEAHGSPVVQVDSSKISTGGSGPPALKTFSYPAPSFDDLIKNPSALAALKRLGITVEEARKRYAAEAPKEMTISELAGSVSEPQPIQYGLALDTFKASLISAIAELATQTPKQIMDANPLAKITLPTPQAIAPSN